MTDEKKDDPIEIVVEGEESKNPPEQAAAPAPAQQQDERLNQTAPEGEGEGEGESGDGKKPERRPWKERRAIQRAARDRDKQMIERLQRELEASSDRLAKLEREMQNRTSQDVDQRLSEALRDYETAESLYVAASKDGNHEDAAKALRYRDEARERAFTLRQAKQKAANASGPQPNRPGAPSIDNRVVALATAWAQDKPWFSFQFSNPESRAIKAIDDEVAAEGFRPETLAYWNEIDRRARERLPELFDDHHDDDDLNSQTQQVQQKTQAPAPGKRVAPPTAAAGQERTSAPGKTTIKLTAARVQMMKDMGVWDDPKQREKFAKIYADYDRTNGST